MKTDRELLELAAKAAGYDVEEARKGKLFLPHKDDARLLGSEWNPLTDDGDAFRLMVELKIDLIHINGGCRAVPEMAHQWHAAGEDGRKGAEEARCAIVRAAAAIGEEMP